MENVLTKAAFIFDYNILMLFLGVFPLTLSPARSYLV